MLWKMWCFALQSIRRTNRIRSTECSNATEINCSTFLTAQEHSFSISKYPSILEYLLPPTTNNLFFLQSLIMWVWLTSVKAESNSYDMHCVTSSSRSHWPLERHLLVAKPSGEKKFKFQ